MEKALNFMGDNIIWIIIIVIILLLALIGNLSEKKEKKKVVKSVNVKKPSVDVNLLEKETEKKILTNTETLDDTKSNSTETL